MNVPGPGRPCPALGPGVRRSWIAVWLWADLRRHRVERLAMILAVVVTVVLASAADRERHQALLLVLGLPGLVLAAALAGLVRRAGEDRRAVQRALLVARGVPPRDLQRLALAEGVLLGLAGGLVGVAVALRVHTSASPLTTASGGEVLSSARLAAAGAGGVVLAVLTTVGVPWLIDHRRTPWPAARWPGSARVVGYLTAVGLLLGAGALSAAADRPGQRSGPMTAGSWPLAAPLLVWVGAGLLAWLAPQDLLRHGQRLLVRGLRPFAGPLAGPLGGALVRRRRRLARAVLLLGLSVAFTVSTALLYASVRQHGGGSAAELRAVTRTLLAGALVLAPASAALTFTEGLAERRRAMAALAVLGGTRRQRSLVVGVEAALLAAGGLLAGGLTGLAVARVLLGELTGLLDPPAVRLAVPWPYLSAAGVLTIGALTAAAAALVYGSDRLGTALVMRR